MTGPAILQIYDENRDMMKAMMPGSNNGLPSGGGGGTGPYGTSINNGSGEDIPTSDIDVTPFGDF